MNRIFLNPSFVGLIGWTFGLTIYLLNWQHFNSLSPLGWFVVTYVGISFFIVGWICRHWFSGEIAAPIERVPELFAIFCILLLTASMGTLMQIRSLGVSFGGLGEIIRIYIDSPLAIRGERSTVDGIGTQLTYFGWPAVFVGILTFKRSHQNWVRCIVCIGIFFIFASNLFFMDRTRPVWIFCMTVFATLAAFPGARKKAARISLGLGITVIVFSFLLQQQQESFQKED